jgi:peptidoglycan/LPS O-acetylase OafA/YrhL
MPIFIPCFFAGILAYKLHSGPRIKLPALLWPVAIGAVTFFYLSMRLHHAGTGIGWLACLALGLLVPYFREIPAIIHAPCRIVATYSYGIYLTHYVTLWLAFAQLSHLSLGLRWLTFAVTTVGATVFLHHFVEQPMIRWGGRLADSLTLRPEGGAVVEVQPRRAA